MSIDIYNISYIYRLHNISQISNQPSIIWKIPNHYQKSITLKMEFFSSRKITSNRNDRDHPIKAWERPKNYNLFISIFIWDQIQKAKNQIQKIREIMTIIVILSPNFKKWCSLVFQLLRHIQQLWFLRKRACYHLKKEIKSNNMLCLMLWKPLINSEEEQKHANHSR